MGADGGFARPGKEEKARPGGNGYNHCSRSFPDPVHSILRFLLFCGVNILSLWVADELFRGISFDSTEALLLSGLVLGIVNTLLRPILVILTFPITVLTLGLFLLVINGITLFLVSRLVSGFEIAGFWTAVGIALVVSIVSFVLNHLLGLRK
jgi:putative membrane protein